MNPKGEGATKDSALSSNLSSGVAPVGSAPLDLERLNDLSRRIIAGNRTDIIGRELAFGIVALIAEVEALRERLVRLGPPRQTTENKDDLARVDGVPEGAHGDLPRPATE